MLIESHQEILLTGEQVTCSNDVLRIALSRLHARSQHRTVQKTAHHWVGLWSAIGSSEERNLLSLPGIEPLFPSLSSRTNFYILLTVQPCVISQTSPIRCTILFNIFIYLSSPHVSGVHVPLCPHDDGHVNALNMHRREINILSRIVHLVGFICEITIPTELSRLSFYCRTK